MTTTILSARDLSVRFGGVLAVNNVSFDVREGEVFTLIGPNGAGKTTVFNLISRIYTPTTGEIDYLGVPAKSNRWDARDGKIDVLEFFWYACPHCYAFEPSLERWRSGLPADVVFRNGYTAGPTGLYPATGVLIASSGANTIQVYGHTTSGAIEQVRFVDGNGQAIEAWDAARLAQEALRPTSGDDQIGGTAGDDILIGGDGNDTLVGLGGNNRFDGGNGNDFMIGAGGADTYVVRAGFGQDRIRDIPFAGALDDRIVLELPTGRLAVVSRASLAVSRSAAASL